MLLLAVVEQIAVRCGHAAAAHRRQEREPVVQARVVVDAQVEIDADPLEEVVGQRDEADFDRHLQVLQAAELLEQVGDLLVNFLRLADDEAQVVLKARDRARAADFVPALRRDRAA